MNQVAGLIAVSAMGVVQASPGVLAAVFCTPLGLVRWDTGAWLDAQEVGGDTARPMQLGENS